MIIRDGDKLVSSGQATLAEDGLTARAVLQDATPGQPRPDVGRNLSPGPKRTPYQWGNRSDYDYFHGRPAPKDMITATTASAAESLPGVWGDVLPVRIDFRCASSASRRKTGRGPDHRSGHSTTMLIAEAVVTTRSDVLPETYGPRPLDALYRWSDEEIHPVDPAARDAAGRSAASDTRTTIAPTPRTGRMTWHQAFR